MQEHAPRANSEDAHMPAPEAPGMFDPRFLIPRLIQRWHWLLIGLIIGLGLAFIGVKRTIPLYKATATVLVKNFNVDSMGRYDPSDVDLRSQEAVETVRMGLERSDLYLEVAADRAVRRCKNLNPPAKPGFMSLFGRQQATPDEDAEPISDAKLSTMIRGWTRTSIQPNSRFIKIRVQHPEPEVTAVIANRIVHHFVELSEKNKTLGAKSSLAFLIKESERVEAELQDAKRLLNSYKSPSAAEASLLKTERLIIELSTRYLEKHPKRIEAEEKRIAQTNRLTKLLNAATENPLDVEYWDPYRDSLTNIEDSSTFAELRDAMVARTSLLQSEIESKETLYRSLLENIETKEVTSIQPESEVVPYETARDPGAPFTPNTKKSLIMGGVQGLAVGLLIAFLFQLADNKFHSLSEIEATLGLPILSTIDRLPDENRLAAMPADLLSIPKGLENVSPPVAYSAFAKRSVHGEMFRILRTSVVLLGDSQKKKITLISSATPSEGKTFVSSNLAIALAKQGTRTLLIDLDLRKPTLHKVFGQSRDQTGIVNLLNKTKPIPSAITTFEGLPELSVIFSGPRVSNPGELLEPKTISELLETLKADYDHIIVDSAPILAVSDTRIVAPLVDNFCLVVRANATPKKAVQAALTILESDSLTPSGVVLNGIQESKGARKKYGYGYGQGQYGSYSEDDE